MSRKRVQFEATIEEGQEKLTKFSGRSFFQCKLSTKAFVSMSRIDRTSLVKALEQMGASDSITTKDFLELLNFVIEMHVPLKWTYSFREPENPRFGVIYPHIHLDRKHYLEGSFES